MIIALAQLNFVVGDFARNKQCIVDTIGLAKKQNADLVVFSELSVCGYPPYDLLEADDFVTKCLESVQEIALHCRDIAAIVGAPSLNNGAGGKRLFNSAFLLYGQKIQAVYHKGLLPTYDVFDEYRYFEPASIFSTIEVKGRTIALTICEDIWTIDTPPLYAKNPLDAMVAENPDCIINISASPFSWSHPKTRKITFTSIAKKYKLPLFVANQVGGHGELIFDGQSAGFTANGAIIQEAKSFEEALLFFDLDEAIQNNAPGWKADNFDHPKNELIFDALVFGIREFFGKQGLSKAVVGLSGGLDSAIVLVLAANALGPENCLAVLMPGPYSTEHSVTDALQLANNLGVPHKTVPIHPVFESLHQTMQPVFGNLSDDITEENYQARIRAIVLMGIANKLGYVLLNTSNKSEAAVGYGTLYGDMCGALAVIADLYKTEIYSLAHYINRHSEIIPSHTITKPPSAELKPDQKDTDSLPEYEMLDQILYLLIEKRMETKQIVSQGFDESLVEKVYRLLHSSEFKRRQAPPVLRVSAKAFGYGRKMPLIWRYKK